MRAVRNPRVSATTKTIQESISMLVKPYPFRMMDFSSLISGLTAQSLYRNGTKRSEEAVRWTGYKHSRYIENCICSANMEFVVDGNVQSRLVNATRDLEQQIMHETKFVACAVFKKVCPSSNTHTARLIALIYIPTGHNDVRAPLQAVI
jgi:hypothetical protein